MTWDGKPEHRSLSGDGDQPPKTAGDYRREISGWLGSRPESKPTPAAEFMREQAERMGWKPPTPEPGPVSADPFAGLTDLGGLDEGAAATHEMFSSHVRAGFSEQQVLFYLACLMQVGNALKAGGLLPPGPGA